MAVFSGRVEADNGFEESKIMISEPQRTMTTEDIDVKPAYHRINGRRRLKALLARKRKGKIVSVCVVLCVVITQIITITILGQHISNTRDHNLEPSSKSSKEGTYEYARLEKADIIAEESNSTRQEISALKVEEFRRETINLIGTESNSSQHELSVLKGSVEEVKTKLTDVINSFEQERVYQCPRNWLARDKSCYHFSHDKETWANAMYICGLFKSHLVEVNSASENAFVTSKRRGRTLWIGLNDLMEEGVWKWSGSDTVASYYNWDSREPTNVNDLENCVIILNSAGKWHDVLCTRVDYYVCEIDLA